jgi:hypothetical protein
MVLTPGVALSVQHPTLAKIIFPVLEPYDLNFVGQRKPNKTKKYIFPIIYIS